MRIVTTGTQQTVTDGITIQTTPSGYGKALGEFTVVIGGATLYLDIEAAQLIVDGLYAADNVLEEPALTIPKRYESLQQPAATTREWPDNGPLRMAEDEALLHEVGDLMLSRLTPHAMTCDDAGCERGKNLSTSEWTRFYALEDHSEWLKNDAFLALLDNRAKEATE